MPRDAWQQLQVVLDSPLAADFTAGYRRLRGYWDAEAKQRLRAGRHPLAFEQLVTVDRHEDHRRMVEHLANSRQPAVVVAASGMCAGGRVVNYLKAMLGDPRHDILFVGYQAAGTPGRDIQQYGPRGGYTMLDGRRYESAPRSTPSAATPPTPTSKTSSTSSPASQSRRGRSVWSMATAMPRLRWPNSCGRQCRAAISQWPNLRCVLAERVRPHII